MHGENHLLSYGLSIKPWFIERVHRALVKADAFKRLKKDHKYYSGLLDKNSERIKNVLTATLSVDELSEWFYRILLDFYVATDDEKKRNIFDSFIWTGSNDRSFPICNPIPRNSSGIICNCFQIDIAYLCNTDTSFVSLISIVFDRLSTIP